MASEVWFLKDTECCIKVDWLAELLLMTGTFGCPTTDVESGSFYAVHPRGSMDDSLLNNKYNETVIVPLLYSNMNKTAVVDPSISGKLYQGPACCIEFGCWTWKTSVVRGCIVEARTAMHTWTHHRSSWACYGMQLVFKQQEMDALYGPFQSAM